MRKGNFVFKVLEILSDPSNHHLIHWSGNGNRFAVTNPDEFARLILPRYFKTSTFSSFVRQLHIYGFQKYAPGERRSVVEFHNPNFVRGREDLMVKINRRGYRSKEGNMASIKAEMPLKTDIDDIVTLRRQVDDLKEENERLKQRVQLLNDFNSPFWLDAQHCGVGNYPNDEETNFDDDYFTEFKSSGGELSPINLPLQPPVSAGMMPGLFRHPSFDNVCNVPDGGDNKFVDNFMQDSELSLGNGNWFNFGGSNDMYQNGNESYDVTEMDMDNDFFPPVAYGF